MDVTIKMTIALPEYPLDVSGSPVGSHGAQGNPCDYRPDDGSERHGTKHSHLARPALQDMRGEGGKDCHGAGAPGIDRHRRDGQQNGHEHTDLARLQLPPPAVLAGLAELGADSVAAGRYLGVMAGSVPVEEVFAPMPAKAIA